MFRSSNFDKLLDKATSNLRLDPDWPTILQLCDLIRQNDCTPKYAVAAIKKKLYSQNPHQAMFALLTLESCVKNCGSGVHDEIASKANCEMLRELVKTTQHENLRNKILELIQAWAFAFRNSSKYRAVQDTVNIMKAEGYKFPPLKESDAMFSADSAPEWSDGDVCHRCRTAFGLVNRKHHCRACGQVFCQQCSSKTSTIPKFGIEKEVRVCDACYDRVSRPPAAAVPTKDEHASTPPPKRSAGGKTAEELQEEEELQLALALSQSEAELKEKEKKRPSTAPPAHTIRSVSPQPSSVSESPEHGADSELSRYLDRGYWEQRRETAPATAPEQPLHHTIEKTSAVYAVPQKVYENGAEDTELEEFVAVLRSQIEIFVNRMKSDSSRGRSIANDTSVQTLFMNLTAMHSRLLRYIQLQDDTRVQYESLQDKVTQTRDSRAALDTLRAEHSARLAAAAEAAERQRQMQMAHKLQMMRKKKHEYLQYQRQLALQRVQEQEREMQMRQEQQKLQYLTSGGQYYGAPFQQFGQPVYPAFQHGLTVEQQQAMIRNATHGIPPSMMQHLRMSMPVQGVPNAPNGAPGQLGAPPQSPVKSQPSQDQPAPGNLGQIQNMVQMPSGATMHAQMGMRPGMPVQQLGPQGAPNQVQMPTQGPLPPHQGQMPPQHGQMTPQQLQMSHQAQINYQQGQIPLPKGHMLPPQGQVPLQQGSMPNQQVQMQHPQGIIPPQGQAPLPQSQIHSQQGQIPPQQGQMPQQCQMPPQQGQMPPQQGQMPPQQGQMPPQQGQMPSAQGQHHMVQQQQIPPDGMGPSQPAPQAPSQSQPAPGAFAPPPQAPEPAAPPASAPVPTTPKIENVTAQLISFD